MSSGGRRVNAPDPHDPGLLTPAETSLLTDQYELAMAASYHGRGMNQPAVFELFVRHLPPHRRWLMAAGLGPALALVEQMRFGPDELAYLRSLRFPEPFLEYLAELRITCDVDAIPEGTVVFETEPLVRVTGPRIEAQLIETLLLNQINFQTAIATKAARIVLAIGGGAPDRSGGLIDFSPRRDHGADAAMKAARSAAIAGAGGTSNVAAAKRYGLQPVGTMAHSYVMSFQREEDAFRAFMEDFPHNAVMLVDTYDTLQGVRNAISAARATGVHLRGVRLDSGDLRALSRGARALLDEAGMRDAVIVASGDLEERQRPGAKQVFRHAQAGRICGDVVALADESLDGRPLLVPAMRGGRRLPGDTQEAMRERAAAELSSLPDGLRAPRGEEVEPYPVTCSERLLELTRRATAGEDVEVPA